MHASEAEVTPPPRSSVPQGLTNISLTVLGGMFCTLHSSSGSEFTLIQLHLVKNRVFSLCILLKLTSDTRYLVAFFETL